jgi:hypothetical protein
VIEYLLGKCKALSSSKLNPAKNRKRNQNIKHKKSILILLFLTYYLEFFKKLTTYSLAEVLGKQLLILVAKYSVPVEGNLSTSNKIHKCISFFTYNQILRFPQKINLPKHNICKSYLS